MQRRIKQEENRRISAWRVRFIVLLIILAAVQITVHRSYYENELANLMKGARTDKQIAEINDAAFQVIDEYGIKQQWMSREDGWWQIQLPQDLSTTRIYADIVQRIQEFGASLKKGEEDYTTGKVELVLTYRNRTILKLRFIKGVDETHLKGYVAIVLDDFGYSKGGLLERAIRLPHDLTFAVIPGLEYSEEIARRAHERGKEIIVHLPMEALEEQVEDKGYTIFVNQSKLQIRDRVRDAIRAIPNAVGVNNHQGSRATADETVMSVVMSELSNSSYYYVDSRTTSESVAARLAARARVPNIANQLFLDVDNDIETIKTQVWKLETLTTRDGQLVSIGHFRENTIRCSKRNCQNWKREVYDL